MIGRREFMTLLGGAAAWPLAASAQQGERVRRIGIIMPASSDDPEYPVRIGAFLQEMQRLGWTIGRVYHAAWRRSGGCSFLAVCRASATGQGRAHRLLG